MTTQSNNDSLFARFAGNPPARAEDIERVQKKLRFRLPEDYANFLLTRNGGEGFVGNSYVILWKIEELVSMNNAYHVSEFVPHIFLFGSNGGGEAFGFHINGGSSSILSIPFVAMEMEDAKPVASDFGTFLSVLSNS
jgi:hypothetical protein